MVGNYIKLPFFLMGTICYNCNALYIELESTFSILAWRYTISLFKNSIKVIDRWKSCKDGNLSNGFIGKLKKRQSEIHFWGKEKINDICACVFLKATAGIRIVVGISSKNFIYFHGEVFRVI